MWCCVGTNFKGGYYFDWSTLSYTRTTSIKKLCKGEAWNWQKWKRKGWKCVKVEVTITEIKTP